MAETNATSAPGPRKGRSWLRIIGWLAAVFVVLAVAVYFIATSGAFFKSVILPRVSTAMNARITVGDASISPFKQVVLKDLRVQSEGQEPLLTAAEVRLHYSLLPMLKGNYNVELVSMQSPVVQMVENPDGSSNLDPILKAQEEQAPQPGQPGPAEPMNVDIKKVTINNGTVRYVKLYDAKHRDVTEVTALNTTLENLKNDFTGKMSFDGRLNVQNTPPAPGTNGTVQGRVDGSYTFSLTRDLGPAMVRGSAKLVVTGATGGLAAARDLRSTLDCDITPTEIKQVALRFEREQSPLGELLVTGPFDMNKQEGNLSVELAGVDKNLLDLAGAQMGLQFGPTTINSTNAVHFSNAGQAIDVVGAFNLNQLQVTRTNQTTPPLDLRANYNLSVNNAASNALLRELTLVGTQNGRRLLHGQLASPMAFSWGATTNAVGDSTFDVTLEELRLADWKPFMGDVAPAGQVSGKLQLVSKAGGKLHTFDLSSQAADLTVLADTNQITQLGVTFNATGQINDLERVAIPKYQFGLSREGQNLLSASGSIAYDLGTEAAEVRATGEMILAKLLDLAPVEGLTLSGGRADYKLHITQTNQAQNVIGTVEAKNLSGSYEGSAFRDVAANMDLNIGMSPEELAMRAITGKLSEGGKAGGSFELKGMYGWSNGVTQITARLADFNQNGLRAFIEPMLSGKRLASVNINGTATAQTDAKGATEIRADMKVANLVVSDPETQKIQGPLTAGMLLNASLHNQLTDVRQFQLDFKPTKLAPTNRVAMAGQFDLADTNAYRGSLKMHADTLDLTEFYDLLLTESSTGTTTPATPGAPGGATAPPAGGPEVEPEPMALPVTNFLAEASVMRFYLRELEITNLTAGLRINGGKVMIQPFRFALNGAPASGMVDLDLGVRGYRYTVNLGGTNLPFAPLVNTFMPERQGQLGGTLTAYGNIKGTGITEASWQKNLSGEFGFGTTNLNFSPTQMQSSLLKTVLNVIGIVPELMKNREAALGTLTGTLLGTRKAQAGGWTDELTQSPIDIIAANGTIGSGGARRVVLQSAFIQSAAFQAMASGTVELAPVLTNSAISIPLNVAVKRSLAEKINFVPQGTPTNIAYVKLPDYVTLKGTVGDPKPAYNIKALLGTALEQLGGVVGDDKTKGLLQGLGGFLSGRQPSASTNAPATGTNAPAQTPGSSLQGLLGGTNRPPVTTTNQSGTNAAPRPTDLLDRWLRR